MLLACLLRLPGLGRDFWLDEYATAWVVQGRWSELPERAAMNNQPPLYFALTWCAAQLFGFHEAGLRIPSLLAGVALVPATWWLSRRFGISPTGALLAAGLVAVTRNCVAMSLEVRPYACVQLLATLQLGLFLRLMEPLAVAEWPQTDSSGKTEPRSWLWLGWIILSALLLYCHFLAGLIFLPELACVALWTRGSRGQLTATRLVGWGAAALAVGLLALPLAPTFREVQSQKDVLGSWAEPPPLWEWLGTAKALPNVLAGCGLVWILNRWAPPSAGTSADCPQADWPQADWPPEHADQLHAGLRRSRPRLTDRLALGSQAIRQALDLPDRNGAPVGVATWRRVGGQSPTAVLLLLWMFLPLLVTWVLATSNLAQVAQPRYLTIMWIAPYLWLAWLVSCLNSRRQFLSGCVGAIVIALLPALARGYDYRADPVWQNHRECLRVANQSADPHLPVLYATQLVEAQRLLTDPRPLLPDYLASPVHTLQRLAPTHPVFPIPSRQWTPTALSPREAVARLGPPVRKAGGCLWFGQPLEPDVLAELWRHPEEPLPAVQVELLTPGLFRCTVDRRTPSRE